MDGWEAALGEGTKVPSRQVHIGERRDIYKVKYLTLGLYACVDCKIGKNGENGEEGITAYMYGVRVLNDDDGRLGRYAIEHAVKR